MIKKFLILTGFIAVMLTGCGKVDIVKSYEESESMAQC